MTSVSRVSGGFDFFRRLERKVSPAKETLAKVGRQIGFRNLFCCAVSLADLSISGSWKQCAGAFVISQIAISFLQNQVEKSNQRRPRIENQKRIASLTASALTGDDRALSDVVDLQLYAMFGSLNFFSALMCCRGDFLPGLSEKIRKAEEIGDEQSCTAYRADLDSMRVACILMNMRNQIQESNNRDAREFIRRGCSKESMEDFFGRVNPGIIYEFCRRNPDPSLLKAQLEEVVARREIDPRFL